jgi:hypothetical protein
MPLDEAERLAALVSCNVLDTDAEAGFDDIAQLASALCGTPIALVSLIDQGVAKAPDLWPSSRMPLPT